MMIENVNDPSIVLNQRKQTNKKTKKHNHSYLSSKTEFDPLW